jgi:hypothetical protein
MLLSGIMPDSLPVSSSSAIGHHTSNASPPQALQASSTADHNKPFDILQATSSVANSEPKIASCNVPGPYSASSLDIDTQEPTSVGEVGTNYVNSATSSSSFPTFIHHDEAFHTPPPYAAELSKDDGPDVPCIVEGHTIIPVYPPKDGSWAYLKVNGITQGYFEGGEYFEVDEDFEVDKD